MPPCYASAVLITREWAMPDASTFSIPPVNSLIAEHIRTSRRVCDPFVHRSPFRHHCVSNDIDTDHPADFHMDALEFLRTRADREFDLVLFDPPYSPRQVSEVYRKVEQTVDMTTTQSSFWADLKVEIRRVLDLDGRVVTCAWNSGGIGGPLMRIEHIMLVAHGGWHHDTIVTVERKVVDPLELF